MNKEHHPNIEENDSEDWKQQRVENFDIQLLNKLELLVKNSVLDYFINWLWRIKYKITQK